MTLIGRGLAMAGLILAVLAPAQADGIRKPGKGDVQIEIADTVAVHRNGNRLTEEGFARLGLYLTDRIQFGMSVGFLPADTVRLGPADVTLNLEFAPIDATGETIPYIGVGAGIADIDKVSFDVDDIEVRTQYGGQIGVKHYLNSHLAIFGELNYRTRDKIDDGRTIVMVGINTTL